MASAMAGAVPRWRPLVVTAQRAAAIWELLQQVPDMVRLLRLESEAEFMALLASPSALFVDVGPGAALLVAIDVEPGHGATVVFIGLDGQVQPHAEAFAEGLEYIRQLAQLRRVTAYIPASLPVLVKLVTRKLGFAWEGVLRAGWAPEVDLLVNGKVWDG